MPCRAVDSTGIKFLGDGALSWFAGKPLPGNKWQARKHGVQGRRQWRKMHLAMDTATSDIRAVEFTPGRDGDSSLLPDLRGQIPEDEQIGTVTAPLGTSRRDALPGSGRRLRYTSLPHRHPRARPHSDHPDPKEREGVQRRLIARPRPQQHLARRGATEGQSGRAGRDTTPAAASRRNLSSFARKRLPVSGCAA
jgi:hypothetical protein